MDLSYTFCVWEGKISWTARIPSASLLLSEYGGLVFFYCVGCISLSHPGFFPDSGRENSVGGFYLVISRGGLRLLVGENSMEGGGGYEACGVMMQENGREEGGKREEGELYVGEVRLKRHDGIVINQI